MTKKSREHKYTDPDLREEIKEDIKQSDKGGRPGQWSARKSQLLAREYERRGGGYTGEKDEGQRNLEKWTEEDWQTQEGETRARSGDETARYLPKEAWEKMSDEEEARDREKEARRLQAGRTVRRQYEGGAAGPQRVAGPADRRLRQPEHRRSGEEGEGALQSGDPERPRLREAAREPQDPHRVAGPQPLAGRGLDREVG